MIDTKAEPEAIKLINECLRQNKEEEQDFNCDKLCSIANSIGDIQKEISQERKEKTIERDESQLLFTKSLSQEIKEKTIPTRSMELDVQKRDEFEK